MIGRSPPRDPLHRAGVLPTVLFTHPFELALGAALVVNSLRAVFGDIAPSIAVLPHWLIVYFFLLSALGGGGVMFGVGWRERKNHRDLGACVVIERASLFLVSGSYLVLAIAVLKFNGRDGAGTAIVVTVVALACILRAIAIRRSAKQILATLTTINRELDEV